MSVGVQKLPVAFEAMGGDRGPSVAVEGAVAAWKAWGTESILVGDEVQLAELKSAIDPHGRCGIQIRHAPEVVGMDETPAVSLRKKPRSSIRIAHQLIVSGEASSVVSAGNTGAMMATGLFELGTIQGISRPAIATLIPKKGSAKPTVLIDSGANTECHARQLVQFAVMGDIYARDILGCQAPRVALLSNGSESSKGTDITRAAAFVLEALGGFHYVGYIEGNDLPNDIADVVVCDGFVGNVLLKGMEGAVKLVFDSIKSFSKEDIRGRLGLWLAHRLLKRVFKEKLDPSAYGGAPLLGLKGVSIVAHGSSDSRALMNALRLASRLSEIGVVTSLERAMAVLETHLEAI
jgi:glycerol-3-phosphate acyltransferase PlsX